MDPHPNNNHNHSAKPVTEHITEWIGSVQSLFVHSAFFIAAFLVAYLKYAAWDTMLLVLTTVVSLEAIYLAIFIQLTVNRHSEELEEVSEDVEGIQENIEGISEDVEDLGEDVEGIQEDIQEMSEEDQFDEERKKKQLVSIEQLTNDVKRVLADLETLRKQ